MKAIRDFVRGALPHSLLLGLALALAGCATEPDWSLTHKLWTSPSFGQSAGPALDPRIELFADEERSDVLVIYDEVRGRRSKPRRRAFFVNCNLERIHDGRKPVFASLGAAAGLKAIPVIRAHSGVSIPPAGLSVLMSASTRKLSLYSDGREIGAVDLPAYERRGAFRKTLLTPLTVTGDTLIVGTFVGLCAAYIWVEGGAPGVDCR